MSTKIEWAEETWNPIIGCSKVSTGCDNCYAVRMAARLASISMKHNAYTFAVKWKNAKPIPEWTGQAQFIESALEKPFKWKKHRRIFVCSMSDLFHETVPFDWIERVWEIMAMCPQHTFLVLTKRPQRILSFFRYMGERIKEAGLDSAPTQSNNLLDYISPLHNVMIGVTAENQEQADKRTPLLLQVPAAKRFVSIEPMLSNIDLSSKWHSYLEGWEVQMSSAGGGTPVEKQVNTNKLDWVIVGGESGPGARPMHPDWVRQIREQCEEAEVPFLFKQWGEFIPSYSAGYDSQRLDQWMKTFGEAWVRRSVNMDDGMVMVKVGKKKAGRELDGKIYNEYPI